MNELQQNRLEQTLFWLSACFYLNGEWFLYALSLGYLLIQTMGRLSEQFSYFRFWIYLVFISCIAFFGIGGKLSLWLWIFLYSAWLEASHSFDIAFSFSFYSGFLLLNYFLEGIPSAFFWIQFLFLPSCLYTVFMYIARKRKNPAFIFWKQKLD